MSDTSQDLEDERYLTSAEAAEYLGVHRKTLLIWTRTGLVTAYTMPGNRRLRRYRRADLDAAMTREVPSLGASA